MDRHQALEFIKVNSRQTKSCLLNPIDKDDTGDWYEPVYLEHRIGNNGNTFILYDAGKHGWDLYFNDGTNDIQKSLTHFSERTGVALP